VVQDPEQGQGEAARFGGRALQQKRHRLRIANKRLRYSIEFLSSILSNENAVLQTTLKHLRKAQESLGELNDASQSRALAARVERNGVNLGDFSQFFDNKREKKLMRIATRAYRKMAALKPL
jgi:CHAD domain-containing protein